LLSGKYHVERNDHKCEWFRVSKVRGMIWLAV
jgi:hypothetical protein